MQRMNLLILKCEGSFLSEEGGHRDGTDALMRELQEETGAEKVESVGGNVYWGTSVPKLDLSSELVPPTSCSYKEMTSSFPSIVILLPVFLMGNSEALAQWPEEGFVVSGPITRL